MDNKLSGIMGMMLLILTAHASIDNTLNAPAAILELVNSDGSAPTQGLSNQEVNITIPLIKDENMSEKINIGIAAADRAASAVVLNNLLADEFVLLVQTLNYHWNLVGPEFHDYHLLFDGQYKAIFEIIDAVAERVRAVGGIALGSMADMLAKATLKESTNVPTPRVMVETLLAQHEALIVTLRNGINKTAFNNNDMGTSNFLTDLIEKHEKIAWMLRSLLGR